MTGLWVPAPAKINLFLNITGRRADGYHELQTAFQLLSFGDLLHFTPLLGKNISLGGDHCDVEPEQNLVFRAATALRQKAETDNRQQFICGVNIDIHKRLPSGGGVGGGSSDAASTLLALNRLWRTAYNLEQLAELGLSLGADVPVFIGGHSCWAEGVGERMQPMRLRDGVFLVLKPPCHISTAEIFSSTRLTRNHSPITIPRFLEQGAPNVCEDVVKNLYPEVAQGLSWLSKYSPAQLTGTGACIFAHFPTVQSAQQVLAQRPNGFDGFIAAAMNRSTAHQMLSLS